MAYCVLACEGVLPKVDALCPQVWTCKGKIIAQFFNAKKSGDESNVTLGENERALWATAGIIFHANACAPAMDNDMLACALRNPEDFARHFWGRYWLIVFDKQRERWLVFADPCGQFPLYYQVGNFGELHLAAGVNEFFEGSGYRPALNTDYLHSYLFSDLHKDGRQTAIEGLSCLPPAHMLYKNKNNALTLKRCWYPLRYPDRQKKADLIELLAKVLSVSFADTQKIILDLSGGVDSTALAVALQKACLHPRTVALTHFSVERNASNEVSTAQRVAHHCGIEHGTYPQHGIPLPFAPSACLPLAARPTAKFCTLTAQAWLAEFLHAEYGDYTHITGHGGDHLFCAAPPFSAPLEALVKLRCIRAVSSVRDLAILYRLPLLVVIQLAIRSLLAKGPNSKGGHCLARQSFVCLPKRPQLAAAASALLAAMGHFDRRYGVASVYPFLLQPIIEWALSWDWEDTFNSNYSRLPVRQSVWRALPLSNIWRRDKGDGTYGMLCGIATHRKYIQEICLNGWCAQQGLIQLDRTRKMIEQTALGFHQGMREIINLFSLEIFVHAIKQAASSSGTLTACAARVSA